MIDLLNKVSLNVYRVSQGQGSLDSNGVWRNGTTEQVIPIKCNLQPYTNGERQIDLPDGIRLDESYYVFTRTPILQADDRKRIKSDEIEIDGVRYECFRVKKFIYSGLVPDHYECIFIKKDKL